MKIDISSPPVLFHDDLTFHVMCKKSFNTRFKGRISHKFLAGKDYYISIRTMKSINWSLIENYYDHKKDVHNILCDFISLIDYFDFGEIYIQAHIGDK